MKKRSKILASLVLAGTMVLGLAGCGDSGSANGGTQSGKNSDAKYQVGICQLVQHEALDAATKGFEDALKDKLGDDVSFDEQNAAGDASTCSTICTKFVTNDYDLILGNATAALQAASAATDSIPILGTSITDYATALDMSDWSGRIFQVQQTSLHLMSRLNASRSSSRMQRTSVSSTAHLSQTVSTSQQLLPNTLRTKDTL